MGMTGAKGAPSETTVLTARRVQTLVSAVESTGPARMSGRACQRPHLRRRLARTANRTLFCIPLPSSRCTPAGLNPDPLIAVQFVTGVGGGHLWHAIDRGQAEHEITQAAGITAAVCGALARVTKYGVYDRPAVPVSYGPCPLCAWTVAIATSSTERKLRLMTPDDRAAGALARAGAHPLLAVNICRAVLAQESSPDAGNGLDHEATVQILAHATSHRPALAIPEDCAEDDRSCQHRPDVAASGDEDWRCGYPSADALCLACSLRAGSWARRMGRRPHGGVPGPGSLRGTAGPGRPLRRCPRRARRMRVRRGAAAGG
jgi:hypothetical protein